MQEKHWTKIWALVDATPTNFIGFPLNQLLMHGIDQHFEAVEEISATASGEA
jgi:hypothetical protein